MADGNGGARRARPGGGDGAGTPRRAALDDPRPGGFRASLLWTVLGTLIPGLGLWHAGRRKPGGILMALFFFGLLNLVAAYFLARRQVKAVLLTPTGLYTVCGVLALGALVWVVTIGYTHLALRPRRPSNAQRAAGAVLVGLLSFAIAAPMAWGSHLSYVTASFMGTVFHSQQDTKSQTRPTIDVNQGDPWKNKPRLNVLILGGDSGKGRDPSLGARTDTVILASIDTRTGDTVLVSIPRNTARMPFPANTPMYKRWPEGFYDGENADNPEYFLNAMYDNVPAELGRDFLGPTSNVGADVLKLSVGEATGLKVDYYALINLDGFVQLIDALGGVTVNVNTRVAMGGNSDLNIPPTRWLEPGPNQHLNGQDALWFARGRYGADDFQRMDRQRCVINAVIRQADPATLLTRYEGIAAAGKKIILTDVPSEILPGLLDLALTVKGRGSIRSIVFKHGVDGWSSPHPDFDSMRARIAAAIAASPPAPTTPQPSGSKTTAAAQPTSTGGGGTENVQDVCAYHPE